MTTWALIPVKRFTEAKTRLSGLLDANTRAALAEAMLRDTLAAVCKVKALDGVALVTSDPIAGRIGKDHGALILDDRAVDLNGALADGRDDLTGQTGPTSVLVLPADLPAVQPQDIDLILKSGNLPASVVIVPAYDRDGTNALLTGPEVYLPYAFGPQSFDRHLQLARDQGWKPETLDLPRIAVDFDQPKDLHRILSQCAGSHTSRLLSSAGLGKIDAFKEVS